MNNPSKKFRNVSSNNLAQNTPDINQKGNIPSKESNTNSSINYEYVTKKRENLYNPSTLNLGSPRKENPNRKSDNKNLSYNLLIKKIAEQLKKRVRLPTCKVIKIYQPYRTLIMRIASGIKKTAKTYNFWNKWEKERTQGGKTSKGNNKFGMSIIKKEEKINSKAISNNDENIKSLMEINDSNLNVNFMDEFENFLGKNNIEIIKGTKLPSFKTEKNEYLLTTIQFWKKYINFIYLKYNKEITFFNFINLIEQFHLWVKDPNDISVFNKLIIQKIELIFEQNEINDFLLMHKLKNIDDLFSKYKSLDKNPKNMIEAKLSDNCQCPTCQNIKEKESIINNNGSIKFPESHSKYKSKNSKITDYYGLSIKLRTSLNKTQQKFAQNTEDKKISDYFSFTKKKEEKKEKTKSKSKSKSKSKKNKNKSKINKPNKVNKSKKQSSSSKMKEIFDLLNLEPEK